LTLQLSLARLPLADAKGYAPTKDRLSMIWHWVGKYSFDAGQNWRSRTDIVYYVV